ncbi:hypothetical protein SAMN04489810_3436 [Microbacterium pygmaeum]|uniref:Uncharacterized protein n=1 Tax=Microbacterium pygmaeum TaxID=370764 RepID=A0A1G8DT51_9MICO|nr:hypothetical protein SAMN04489810_3436 [Microbacterium pygmaeum]
MAYPHDVLSPVSPVAGPIPAFTSKRRPRPRPQIGRPCSADPSAVHSLDILRCRMWGNPNPRVPNRRTLFSSRIGGVRATAMPASTAMSEQRKRPRAEAPDPAHSALRWASHAGPGSGEFSPEVPAFERGSGDQFVRPQRHTLPCANTVHPQPLSTKWGTRILMKFLSACPVVPIRASRARLTSSVSCASTGRIGREIRESIPASRYNRDRLRRRSRLSPAVRDGPLPSGTLRIGRRGERAPSPGRPKRSARGGSRLVRAGRPASDRPRRLRSSHRQPI